MLVPQMPGLPMKPSGSAQAVSTGGPRKLKRSKHPTSQAQRSRTARSNAKNAARDEAGKFAKKGFFTHVFDGIEKFVGGVKKTHRKVKKVTRTVKRAFKSQPRQVVTSQRRKRRKSPKPSARQAQRTQYRQSVLNRLIGW